MALPPPPRHAHYPAEACVCVRGVANCAHHLLYTNCQHFCILIVSSRVKATALFCLLFSIWLVDTFYAQSDCNTPTHPSPTLSLLSLSLSLLDSSLKLAGKQIKLLICSLVAHTLDSHLCVLRLLCSPPIQLHFNCDINVYQINPYLAKAEHKVITYMGS